ncbi:putative protein [Arabidopsis thaliana]|uniref:Uncharacterized protein AT4g20690 n=1 Tax=Arabidopsis thaliana TaxID=3702 RepID=Q9SVH8_ARATH|nr:uncharacterized protein AT4G20690 [Arabidopsis thaliana]AEE84354.1 hypothetical protein AT4G20690 [Arabidopsis thaliana]CAB45835.1 putative protein [Arabidopsis thaliana]CAB79069.1 putative protein [Arabidopsis thaliana]|eukprot:NP_193801.1 hypothetical protein AT4G20690 [Arabidopsis thaliana]
MSCQRGGIPRGHLETKTNSSDRPSQPARHLTRLKHLVSRSVSSSSSARPSQAARQLTRPKYLASRPIVFRPQARLSSTIGSFLLYLCLLKKSSFVIRPIRLSRGLVINRKILLPSLEIPFSYLCDSCINSCNRNERGF